MRLGLPGAAAGRPASPFPAVGNLFWSSAPLECPLPTLRHPGYVFSQTWIFLRYRETTGEITAGLFFSRLRVSPHGHAFSLGRQGTQSWANEHPQPRGREMKGICAAEWKLYRSVLSSAICPFKLHCNTGRRSPTRARTSLPAAFLRPYSLSVFLFPCSPRLTQGWLRRRGGPGGCPRCCGPSFWSALRPVSRPGWRVRAISLRLAGWEPAEAEACARPSPRVPWSPRTCAPFPVLPES